MLRRFLLLAVASSLLSVPSAPSARAACDVTPYVGAMIPTKSMIVSLPSGGSGTIIRNSPHTVYGLAISTSMSEKFGAELVLGAGSGDLEVVGGSTVLALNSTVLIADLRGKYRISGNDDASIGLVGGVGYTTQKIGLFDYAQTNDLGEFKAKLTGIVGLSFDAALSDRLHLSMEMVDRIREQGIVIENTTGIKEPTQHDVTVTAGLSFALGK